MGTVDGFWTLGACSDRELIEGLKVRVGNGRHVMAEVLAHLGEVEDRRLHLVAGYSSMFAYCVSRLGMSEDEACRRIDVARLARRWPALFPCLATGQISLSVAALLKPYLSNEGVPAERAVTEGVSAGGAVTEGAVTERAMGHVEVLIAAVSGKSVQQAREALAALFPRPDVEPSIRKLPGRAPAVRSSPVTVGSVAGARGTILQTPGGQPGTGDPDSSGASSGAATPGGMMSAEPVRGSIENVAAGALGREDPRGTSLAVQTPQPFVLEPPRAERLEPLSPGRYRVQFTADAALKEKLELARDLMRHTLPGGDLAALVERSLDLLIEHLMKRRFGAPSRRANQPHTPQRTRPPTSTQHPTSTQQPTPATQSEAKNLELPFTPKATPTAHPPERFNEADAATCTDSPPTDPAASRFDRATRRAVLERDGLRCAWRSADGVRCEARAWLEHDHIQPRARGGRSSANNGRILCRAHNRLAAEQEFGRQHVERAITKQRARRRPIPSGP